MTLLRATWWSISLKTKHELRYIPLVPEPMTPPLQDQGLWSGPSPHRHLGAYMEARAKTHSEGQRGTDQSREETSQHLQSQART